MQDWTGGYDEFGGVLDAIEGSVQPPSRTKVTTDQLRKKQQQVSSSVTTNIAAQLPVSPSDATSYGPGNTGVSALRGPQVKRATEGIERDTAELEKHMGPQDYTQMQGYAKQRAGEGKSSLLLALAAQTAGEEYAPMSGAFLKRAMAARDPLKTATGLITDTGEHIEDPQARAEQQVKLIQARISRNEQIINSAASAEERQRAEQQNQELRRLQITSMQAYRDLALATSSANRAGQSDDRRFRGEDRMKNDFEQVTKSARDGLTASQQVRPVMGTVAGRRLSNVEQQALITLFNKFLDPESVVREGEFNRMAQGMGLAQRIQNWGPKVMSGSIITPEMAQEIAKVAEVYERDALRRIHEQSASYGMIAQQRGYDPAAIITNPVWRGQQEQQGPPPGSVRPIQQQQAPPVPAAAPPMFPPGAVRPKGAQ